MGLSRIHVKLGFEPRQRGSGGYALSYTICYVLSRDLKQWWGQLAVGTESPQWKNKLEVCLFSREMIIFHTISAKKYISPTALHCIIQGKRGWREWASGGGMCSCFWELTRGQCQRGKMPVFFFFSVKDSFKAKAELLHPTHYVPTTISLAQCHNWYY